MSDPIEAFFGGLARGGHGLLRKTSGSLRFELAHDRGVDLWHLTIGDGRIVVRREDRAADAVIRTDRDFFVRMAGGHVKPLPAWLRNDLTVEGQFRFVILLERLFEGPPGARHPRELTADRREST